MPKLSVLFRIPTPELLLEPKAGFIRVNEKQKFRIMLYFAILTLVAAFFFNSPVEIYQALWRIIMSPSILLTDYMVVGNIGSAFFNSGLLMLITILITRRNKVVFSGPIVAAIFTIGGFAFFGKNIFNVSPIMVGVLVFAKLRREPFRTLILPAFSERHWVPWSARSLLVLICPCAFHCLWGSFADCLQVYCCLTWLIISFNFTRAIICITSVSRQGSLECFLFQCFEQWVFRSLLLHSSWKINPSDCTFICVCFYYP